MRWLGVLNRTGCSSAWELYNSIVMGAGRPTKYKEEYAEQAYKLSLLGHTDEEMATFFSVHVDTIYEWKNKHEEFSEAITRGKQVADIEVAEALFDGARDREVLEQQAFKVRESVQ